MQSSHLTRWILSSPCYRHQNILSGEQSAASLQGLDRSDNEGGVGLQKEVFGLLSTALHTKPDVDSPQSVLVEGVQPITVKDKLVWMALSVAASLSFPAFSDFSLSSARGEAD
ncbi:hypothetical protein DNTS_030023 [Danionella cerebrum]|uniref:Uncharacterized protein n=1 Tax=Danionella cerebrum TaxID=2873325 RepID=A0A553NRT2_9TELE|nr:hypothetical protein DNTS_030023 [Danionella translucida]